MKGVGYVVSAYVGAALLYGGYVLRLLTWERALQRRDRDRAR